MGIIIGNKNYWGKGIATEAIKVAVNFAFNKMGLEELNLGVISENKPAIRVYEKVGFKIDKINKNVLKHEKRLYDQVMMKIKK